MSAVEAIGDIGSALAGYQAATRRWPENSLAWLGMGNAFYTQGNLDSAENAYRQILSLDPENLVALNNLSQVQNDRGCFEDATATLDAASASANENTTIYKTIQMTRSEIERQKSSADCLWSSE